MRLLSMVTIECGTSGCTNGYEYMINYSEMQMQSSEIVNERGSSLENEERRRLTAYI
jgi:hypothetical protein